MLSNVLVRYLNEWVKHKCRFIDIIFCTNNRSHSNPFVLDFFFVFGKNTFIIIPFNEKWEIWISVLEAVSYELCEIFYYSDNFAVKPYLCASLSLFWMKDNYSRVDSLHRIIVKKFRLKTRWNFKFVHKSLIGKLGKKISSSSGATKKLVLFKSRCIGSAMHQTGNESNSTINQSCDESNCF
jgi:hypothetical protein